MKKPIISFFIGYTRDFINSDQGIFGAEIVLKNLAEELTKYYEVYIFGPCLEENQVNKVHYKNSFHLKEFSQRNTIDYMIVHRYIYYFLEFETNIAKKTYVWFHDIGAQHSWDFKALPEGGKPLLKNVLNKIEKIIVLTDWHKKQVLETYQFPKEKLTVIGNALKENIKPSEKTKDSFIWFQSPDRGLIPLLENFHKIKKILPDAKLDIYGDETWLLEQGINTQNLPNYIKHFGEVSNKEILTRLQKTEYWLYTLASHETYCLSALEAQAAGCMCIATNSTGLADTLGKGNRGILINKEYNSEEYWQELIKNLEELKNNPSLKKKYVGEAQNWAEKQTYKNKALEWKKILK